MDAVVDASDAWMFKCSYIWFRCSALFVVRQQPTNDNNEIMSKKKGKKSLDTVCRQFLRVMLLFDECTPRLQLHHHKFIIIIMMHSIRFELVWVCSLGTTLRRGVPACSVDRQPHRNRSCILISLTFAIIIIFAFTLLLLFRFTDDRRQSFQRRRNENVIWMRAVRQSVLMTSLWIGTKLGDDSIDAAPERRIETEWRASGSLHHCITIIFFSDGNGSVVVFDSMTIDTNGELVFLSASPNIVPSVDFFRGLSTLTSETNVGY